MSYVLRVCMENGKDVIKTNNTLELLIKNNEIAWICRNPKTIERLYEYDLQGLFQNNLNFRYTFVANALAGKDRNRKMQVYYVPEGGAILR